MTRTEILARLQPVFDQVFVEPVTVSAELTADDVPEWDSLLHISLIVAVQSAFRIRFRVGEVAATRNVGELADLIAERLTDG